MQSGNTRLSLTTLCQSKSQLRFFLISSLFFTAACSTLFQNENIYSKNVHELPNGLYYVKVESRLEYEAQSVMLREANSTCEHKNKQRMLIIKNETTYISPDQSTYDTGYYKLEAEIKCK